MSYICPSVAHPLLNPIIRHKQSKMFVKLRMNILPFEATLSQYFLKIIYLTPPEQVPLM